MNKYKLIGISLYNIYKLLMSTLRRECYYFEDTENKMNDPSIVVFWHGKIFPVCSATKIIKKKATIISASKDGDMLGELLRGEGSELIRGSSNRDNIKSLKEAVRYAKKKYSIGIAIDGPKGPIYEPKPGAIFIAQKTGFPILPISSYTSKSWVLEKLWDKMEIPKPFSRNIQYVGEPFYLSKDVEIEEAKNIIKENINKCTEKAYEIYKKKYILKEK